MSHRNDRKALVCRQNYTLLLIGFVLIFQDVQIVPSYAYPQNNNPGFLFGFLQPPPIVRNIIHGVEETVQNLLPGPLRNQQTQTTTIKTTTTTTTTATTPPQTTEQSNPFQFIWDTFQPKPSASTIVTTNSPTTLPANQKSPNFFDAISGIISGVMNPFNIFQSPNRIQTTTTTTEAPNPIGNIFNGIGQLLGWAPTTTTTTLYPPPRGGRGFSGLVYNIIIIINDFLDMLDNAMLLNDDWVPGYMAKKLADVFESIKAEIQIFLQSDQPGGLFEIWESLSAVWQDLNEIFKVITSGDIGRMVGLPFLGGQTIQNILKLTGEFAIQFPTVPPAPGIKPHTSERVRLNQKEFQNIMNHTENLIENLLHIQEIVEKEFPNNTILQILGYFRGSFEKALEDSKATGKPIVLNTIQTMFPNALLAKYIANFGKILSQTFQNFPPIQFIGNLLQQELLVNIGLTIVQSFVNPIFENIEKFIEYFVENISSRYLSLDPDHFIVHLLETFENRIASFGEYLEEFQNLTDKAKINFTEGDVLQQITKITQDILTSKETSEFIRKTVANILKIIPLDFGEDAVHGVTSAITLVLTGFIKLLSRGLQMVFPVSPTQTPELMNVTTLTPVVS